MQRGLRKPSATEYFNSAEFGDHSDNPAEDEQPGEEDPVIVGIPERSNCDEAPVQEWLVE
jgi:hypothetical protein